LLVLSPLKDKGRKVLSKIYSYFRIQVFICPDGRAERKKTARMAGPSVKKQPGGLF